MITIIFLHQCTVIYGKIDLKKVPKHLFADIYLCVQSLIHNVARSTLVLPQIFKYLYQFHDIKYVIRYQN